MKFIDYNSYIFENIDNDLQYYYFESKNKILYIVLKEDKTTLGYINLWFYLNNDWEAYAIAAEHGYGYKMFEAALDFIYPDWFIPTRNKAITQDAIKSMKRLLENSNIETEKIDVDDKSYMQISNEYEDWFNRRYRLKNKLNINFNKVNYNFIKRTGIKLFSKKYPWNSKNTLY